MFVRCSACCLVVGLLTGLSGCVVTLESKILKRAQADMACGKKELHLRQRGGDIFTVTGCGHHASYGVVPPGCQQNKCSVLLNVLDGEEQ